MNNSVNSIKDVALEFNILYSQSKRRGEKNNFIPIIKVLFEKYSGKLGYSNIHDFKSDVVQAKNAFNKRIFNSFYKINAIRNNHLNPSKGASEGSGRDFVEQQIQEFNLNSDSY